MCVEGSCQFGECALATRMFMQQLRYSHILYVLTALCLGGALRIYNLAGESFWLDEISSVLRVSWTYGELFEGTTTESMMPLYYLIQKGWCDVFGIGELGFRLSSVLYGTLSIMAIYGLVAEVFNRRTGIVAAFVCALHPFAIYYSREARPYSLFFLLSIVSYYFFFRVLRSGSVTSCLGCVLSTGMLMYTHVYSSFLILGQFLLALFYFFLPEVAGSKMRFSSLTRAWALTVMAGIPLFLRLPDFFSSIWKSRSGFEWLQTPSWNELIMSPTRYWFWFRMGEISCLLLCILTILGFRRYRAYGKGLSFVCAVLCSCLFLPWLFSVLVSPVFLLRYTIATLIGLVTLLAFVVSESRSLLVRGVLIVPLVMPLPTLLNMRHKDLWREAGDFLNRELRPGDIVIADPDFLRPPMRYYLAPQFREQLVSRAQATALLPELNRDVHIWAIESYLPIDLPRRQPYLESAGEVKTLYKDIGEIGMLYKVEGSQYHLTRDPIYLSLTTLAP